MKIHKKEVAKRQIDTAIELFLNGHDILSVVTLAGAGEEILGKLLERSGKKSMRNCLVDLDKKLSAGGRPYKTVNGEIDGFWNSLKHADDPSDDIIELDQEHAIAMLSRAMANYYFHEQKLSLEMDHLYNWLKSNRSDLFIP